MIVCYRARNPNYLTANKDLSGKNRAYETVIDVNTDKIYEAMVKIDKSLKNNGENIVLIET